MASWFARSVAALSAFAAADVAAPPLDRYPPFGLGGLNRDFKGLAGLQDHFKLALRKDMHAAARHAEDPLWHPQSLERLLLLPEHKLMVCLTDGSPVGELLNVLNGKTGEAAESMLGSSAIAGFGWSEAQTRLALESDEWYTAVFLRDPLERFLLAFFRECAARGGSDGSACLFFEDVLSDPGHGEDLAFADFVDIVTKGFERFPQRFSGIDRQTMLYLDGRTPDSEAASSDGSRSFALNPHFTPQSQFCGGLNASHYDFVGDVGRDMHHQLGQILATVGATGNEALLTRLYPPTSVGSQASSVLRRAEYQQHYAHADTIMDVRRIYANDYQLLKSASVEEQRQQSQVCMNTVFALDFEKRRILDWIAYHSLMGVDCFYLFHDTNRSSLSDPEVKEVLDQLMDSPNVTVFTAHSLRDRGRLANTEEWFKYFPARYLLMVDVDEFVVLDGSRTDSAQNSLPDSLFEYLEALDLVSRQAAGVYLSRWDYGTSGYIQPPSVDSQPEFALLTERWGAKDRVRPQKALGKLILNMRSGFPKYLSVHHWNPAGGGHMLFPNGTAMCLQPCGHSAHNPPLPESRQPISLNHYATGSLSECKAKAIHSQFKRDDRDEECQQLHPGTEAYRSLLFTDQVSQDLVMVKYANATRGRRAELFQGRGHELTKTTRHVPSSSTGAFTSSQAMSTHLRKGSSGIGARESASASGVDTAPKDVISKATSGGARPSVRKEAARKSLQKIFAR